MEKEVIAKIKLRSRRSFSSSSNSAKSRALLYVSGSSSERC